MKKFLLVVLSLMTIGFSSTFADAKYLGGWDFGIQDTLHIVPSPNLNNDHIKFSCFQNVLDVSTNYQGIVPIGNNVNFTFLFGGMFSYVSNEYCKGVSIKDGWYFNDNPKRVYHKGDIVYDLILENSDLGLGLDLGLGFDIRNSDKFAFGIIYMV